MVVACFYCSCFAVDTTIDERAQDDVLVMIFLVMDALVVGVIKWYGMDYWSCRGLLFHYVG